MDVPCNGACPDDFVPCANFCLSPELVGRFWECDGDDTSRGNTTVITLPVSRHVSERAHPVPGRVSRQPDPVRGRQRVRGHGHGPAVLRLRRGLPPRVPALQRCVVTWRGNHVYRSHKEIRLPLLVAGSCHLTTWPCGGECVDLANTTVAACGDTCQSVALPCGDTCAQVE